MPFFRFSQIGIVSFGLECPSRGVYARVTEVKHWIQFIAGGAVDSNCEEITNQPGKKFIHQLSMVGLISIFNYCLQHYW